MAGEGLGLGQVRSACPGVWAVSDWVGCGLGPEAKLYLLCVSVASAQGPLRHLTAIPLLET